MRALQRFTSTGAAASAHGPLGPWAPADTFSVVQKFIQLRTYLIESSDNSSISMFEYNLFINLLINSSIADYFYNLSLKSGLQIVCVNIIYHWISWIARTPPVWHGQRTQVNNIRKHKFVSYNYYLFLTFAPSIVMTIVGIIVIVISKFVCFQSSHNIKLKQGDNKHPSNILGHLT